MEEDRISQLPDDILLLILDKIDIHEAVKTMILSKIWKNLWCSLPGLRFHLNPGKSFILFKLVSQLLSHRDATASVHDFHITIDNSIIYRYLKFDSEFLEECVIYAINHGIRSLRLHTSTPPTKLSLRLPEAFISCKTLRELELRQSWDSSIKVPGRLSLPNLKTLHLGTELVSDDDHHIMEPFSGLPELEKLTLSSGPREPSHWIVIKAPKLRVLEISCYFLVKEIYAALLTSFRYECHRALKCAEVNLPMLEQVYIDITEVDYCFNRMHKNIVSMLPLFGNATIISLTLDTLKILERNGGPFEQTPSPLPNMKCLNVMAGLYGQDRRVYRGVIDYLTRNLCCEIELSLGVVVVEQFIDEEKDIFESYGHSYIRSRFDTDDDDDDDDDDDTDEDTDEDL